MLQMRPRKGMRSAGNHTAAEWRAGLDATSLVSQLVLLDFYLSVSCRGSRHPEEECSLCTITAEPGYSQNPETEFPVHTFPSAWMRTNCLLTPRSLICTVLPRASRHDLAS